MAETKFKEGQIIVSEKTQKTSCGTYVQTYAGEINKVSDPDVDFGGDIRVYRNIDRENINRGNWAKERIFRSATPEEETAYAQGKRNISEICQSV